MGEVPPPELGRKLSYPSYEGISNLCFSNYSDHLLVASWDGMVRLYDASTDVLKGVFAHLAAVLDCCFQNQNDPCFTASIDKSVNRYKFKSKPTDGWDTGYSVNAIAFQPTYGTCATGCFGGYVNVLDGDNQKYPTSVASVSFSRDGLLLAVASSYTYEDGDTLHEPDAIFVRSINEVEVKPKP